MVELSGTSQGHVLQTLEQAGARSTTQEDRMAVYKQEEQPHWNPPRMAGCASSQAFSLQNQDISFYCSQSWLRALLLYGSLGSR